MVRKVKFLDIPCAVEMTPQKLPGLILQMNLTGVMVEMDAIPFRVGAILNLIVDPSNPDLAFTAEVRSVKSYEAFYREPLTVEQKKTNPGKRLAELHFVKLSEPNRQKIIHYIGKLKATMGKK